MKKAADVVRWLGAVQSQDYPNAKYAIALRMQASTDAQVSRAFDAGEIVRTHALRPTWHFLAADDLRWILALTGPRVQLANAAQYRRMELDDVVLNKAHTVIRKALQDRQYRTRAELAAILEAKGIRASAQRGTYIAMHAELHGLICSGPARGKQHTYALVDERVPKGKSFAGDEALAELARRYFTSHGPATLHDFAWWSGQTVGAAKRAVEMLGDGLESSVIAGKTYWFTDGVAVKMRAPVVHLLPNYDEHVVAYRDHGPSLDPRNPHALYGWGNALTPHLVVLNGLVIGGWKRRADRDGVVIEPSVPVPLQAREQRALEWAAAEYSRYLGEPVRLGPTS